MASVAKTPKLSALKGLPEFCEQYRLRAQEHLRPYATGRHIQLVRGQSLEFRDYAPYTRGDDVRYIDWRASFRSGKEDEWIVRRFQAEEGFNIVVSVDTRESMSLPYVLPKVSMAGWAAQAIAHIALRSDDRVYFHRLFGTPGAVKSYQRPSAIPLVFPAVQKIVSEAAPEDAQFNLHQLHGGFFTNAALVILSDFYFATQPELMQQFANFVLTAERGWRWIILINLDSWPYEAWELKEGRKGTARRILGPGLDKQVECDAVDETAQRVGQNIQACQKSLLDAIHRPQGFDLTWRWDRSLLDEPLHFFEKCFTSAPMPGTNRQNPFFQLFIRQR